MAFSQKRNQFHVESRELTAQEAALKELILSRPPISAQSIVVLVGNGGGHQVNGRDFYLAGNALKWDGKRLDGLLAEGDELSIVST